MFKTSRSPILSLIAITLAFLLWNVTYKEEAWLKSAGINGIQLFAAALSFIWLSGAYSRQTDRYRNFWLLLSLGMLCSMSGSFISFLIQASQKVIDPPAFASFFWVLSYLFLLAAMVYKAKETGAVFSNKTYLFNIIIYMITAIGISYYFLIGPLLLIPDTSLLISLIAIGYQVADLGILFFSIMLYYYIQFQNEKRGLLFLIAGLLLQLIADSLLAYLSIAGIYQTGNIVEFMWIIALLLIGFTGFYEDGVSTVEYKKPDSLFKKKEYFLPYASIILLTVLVIYSYQWDFNALSGSFLITFLMVLGRQLFIIIKNSELLDELKHLAYHDPLTGLANRFCFIENIKLALKENSNNRVALLLIDLDRFKVVNDTLGHHIGDLILVETAARLSQVLDTNSHIYRLGGDEFVVILAEASEESAAESAKRILESFQKSFSVMAYEIDLTPSIGISLFPEHGTTQEDLLKNADAAMYLSKEKGKNEFTFYNAELNRYMKRKMEIENQLKRAIDKNQFSLVYQPKVNFQTNEIIGMEALLRWEHPEYGWVSPAEFIPIAEETGQIEAIGKWVLETACKQNKIWQNQGLDPLSVSVNVSVLQFQNGKFLKTVKTVLQESQLDAQFLELEITESIMQNMRESMDILTQIKELGVKISIDDFGTGYSSLHILSKLPIDTIKIDKSFIDELDQLDQSPIIKAIIDLSLNLNLSIVAEGIETENQLEFLQKSGCMIGQGYLFSKPLKTNEFEHLIRTKGVRNFEKQQSL
ncbi:bifunctional diguanylate cyclase/phosphodiesterase [Planomicrobium sp. CPCC 101079]|uniref:putative bifunctional diguanylate cyclase/phosphodiesterase n=1 Tax=Planomicrobium sp. CPCC 101079 TaxID=2599618 RepID=UPI002102D22E|nr:EAL domain-containing protein [Planomicrobium sp. CPCC 101079]